MPLGKYLLKVNNEDNRSRSIDVSLLKTLNRYTIRFYNVYIYLFTFFQICDLLGRSKKFICFSQYNIYPPILVFFLKIRKPFWSHYAMNASRGKENLCWFYNPINVWTRWQLLHNGLPYIDLVDISKKS